MKQIFSQLFYEVEKRRDTVLVTLIADRGSAPRKAGAQMLVGAEGRLVGTIGGGAVEGRSIQLCRELLDQRRSCIREFPLHQAPEQDIGMVCGGDVTAHFQFIPAFSDHSEPGGYRRVAGAGGGRLRPGAAG